MLLSNRYQLVEKLGQGGAGAVYRAFDTKFQRPVAVKYLDSSKTGPDQGIERLRREAALLSRLTHPNIVGFYDLGKEAEKPFLVLEYISGSTLRALLEAHETALPIEFAVHVIRSVLAALSAAHQAGITHRDLKPENVMLVEIEPESTLDLATQRPEIKVMDFGLAHLSGEVRITSENLVAGTALYLAPEAALGQPVDGRADLYAVGMILYEMIAGRAPFSGADPLAIISQHLHATPISPRWHNASVPSALAAITLKLLTKSPADRYQTVEAVLADLTTFQQTGGEDRPLTKASLLETIARGRLVGRQDEMALLRSSFDAMLRGTGKVIFIEGGPGIGKSRLVSEASVYARLKGVQTLTGHCYDAELALPYQPFIEIVKAFVQTNFEPGSTGSLPMSLTAQLVKLAPALETHLGVAPAPSEASPAEARLQLFEAVTSLLTSRPGPLMLIFENLHRASPPDLALFLHLALTGTRHHRLLLLGTYRGAHQDFASVQALSGTIAQLDHAGLTAHLNLQPLSSDNVSELLEALLEGEVTSDFCRAIFAASEGNPFFIEEILKALIEEDRIYRSPDRNRWEGAKLEDMEIPTGLRQVISRRFDRLTRTEHHLLSLAALLGRQFRLDALMATVVASNGHATQEADEDQLLEALDKALDMQLIQRVQPAERVADTEVYEFEHSLIHQALQEDLSARQRVRMHRQIGHALEKLNQNRSQPFVSPDELAYHFSMAGGDETEKAISYSLIAVENALQVYATEIAIKHYQLILDLLGDEADVTRGAWVMEQLGDLYFYRTRQMVDAVAAYEWAIQLWQTVPEPDTRALIRLYRNIGEIARYWQGHVEKLDRYLVEALRLLDQDPTQAESIERVRLLAVMAFNLLARQATEADYKKALELAQTAAGLAVKLDAVDEESTALDAMQRIYRAQGDLAAAHQIDRRRQALIPRLTNPTEAVDTNLAASRMGWETGDLAEAVECCREALTLAQRIDNIGGQREALARLMMLHLQWGKLSAAMTYAEQGVGLGPRAGLLEFGEPVEALFRTHLAILQTIRGQAEEAARELAELSALYPTADSLPYRAALGWLHYETEAWEEARLNLEGGAAVPPPFLPKRFDLVFLVDVYGHLGDQAALDRVGPAAEAEVGRGHLPFLETVYQRGYGAFYTEQEAWTEAEAAFKRALAATSRQMFWYQDARTWLDYGRMLARRNQPGDPDIARDFLSEAQSMFTTFGAHALAEKAWLEVTRLVQQ